MPIHPTIFKPFDLIFPSQKSGSYLTSWYHRSMHRRCMNTSQNASKSFTKTLFKCSKPRSLIEGLVPLGPPPGLCLDPLGTLSCPQTPCGISSPRTPKPGSAPGSYIYFCNRWVNVRPTRCVCDNMLF